MVVPVELAQQVARVVVGDAALLGHLHRRQLALDEQLGELLRARADRPGPFRRGVVADHFEQLGPEDPDHRGARTGGDDDSLAAGTLERVERRAGDLRRLLREAGVPGRLPAARLALGAVDLAPGRAQHLHDVGTCVGLEEIDQTGHQQRHAHEWRVSPYPGADGRPTTPASRSTPNVLSAYETKVY